MTVCTVHLVRHAAHRMIDSTLAGRTPGVALSDEGRRQAGALAATFAGLGVTSVLTSPVQRARETADQIATHIGLAAKVEPGLEEIDFGAWAGQTFDALTGAPGWLNWNNARGIAATPAGDTMLKVQARAIAALTPLQRNDSLTIAVTHGDVIKAVIAYALGMPMDLLHRLEIGTASRSVLVLGPGFIKVEAVNLPP